MVQDADRGRRIREAIRRGKIRKVHAVAAELDVSVAAVSRWQNGGHTSLENACALAKLLDVSLDWLLLGRATMDWHHDRTISAAELKWIIELRRRPKKVQSSLTALLEAIPPQQNLR